ncbi:MAG: M23 family metallopeptidase [Myxococcota bacterium]
MRLPPPAARRRALITIAPLLSLGLLVAACDSGDGTPARPVPAGHPCPDVAIPPTESSVWAEASETGAPTVPLTLLIPFADGVTTTVSQGNQQGPTHTGRLAYAWDFDAAVGTAVHAAAPGIVTIARDDSSVSGPDASFEDDANYVLLDHGGGLFTMYAHLGEGDVVVTPGQTVAAGALLGYTGLSGQLTGPHLHFHVENLWSDTLPARFVSRSAPFDCSRAPSLGDGVFRPSGLTPLLVAPLAESQVPTDAFADMGVRSIEGLPARLFRRDHTYRLTGQVDPKLTRLFLLVVPEGGGPALFTYESTVTLNGFFASDLRFDAVGDKLPAGRYGWAVIATNDKSVTVPRSIRMTLLP